MPVPEIYNVWLRAKEDEHCLNRGLRAYYNYNEKIRHLADRYGIGLDPACGAFAALSPNNDEAGNFRDLTNLMQGVLRGADRDTISVSTYRINRDKAWKILSGSPPLDVLRGLKTRAFYHCLKDPGDKSNVVVDGHIYSVWMGKRFRMSEARITPQLYERIANDFIYLSSTLSPRTNGSSPGVSPSQLQAVCWFTWKKIHQVLYRDKSRQFVFSFEPSPHIW